MNFRFPFLVSVFLFFVGGFLYGIVEMLFKGNTHISMIIAGGLAFILIGRLNEGNHNPSLLGMMVISSILITVIELITGVIVNLWLHLGVWDYSKLPYNFMGQICLLFSVCWFGLSFIAILVDDYIRYLLLGGKKPHYHFM